MKGNTMNWHPAKSVTADNPVARVRNVSNRVRERTRRARRQAVFSAAVAGASSALILVAVWAASGHAVSELASLVALSGLVFLAMAVDARGRLAAAMAASGLALGALGWLAWSQHPEFGVAGVTLLVAWLGFGWLQRDPS